ncbi:hypothetical protein HanIR_Chr05g0246191 [Helianthus annuus]|nr:hypothetical protein HanIR_Chr05g0246191 [Helianthus annuus]
MTAEQQLPEHHRCNGVYGEFHIVLEAPLKSVWFHQLWAQAPLRAGNVSPVLGPSQYASGTHQVL